ncbi:MAG: indole-3-glycerol phosphate synthase TrpC [Bacillaceae bacterium]
MTFLEMILSAKREEIEKMEAEMKRVSLYETLKTGTTLGVIGEIKRYSPSKGLLLNEGNVIARAKNYEENGVACISILTDSKFFKGSFEDLHIVSKEVKVPLLCKDFILSPIQIDKAKSNGASVILLIIAILTTEQYQRLYEYGVSRDLEVIVEVHNEEELNRAFTIQPKIIGINNRDLKTFTVDLQTTAFLVEKVKKLDKDVVIISESGISNKQDAQFVKECGVQGILVGEALMKAVDYGRVIRELRV